MNPYCRACKHEVSGHTNRICGKIDCYCGALTIDNEGQESRPSKFDADLTGWKADKSKFNPKESKIDRTQK